MFVRFQVRGGKEGGGGKRTEEKKKGEKAGLVRESNPGPLAPEARIIPLDQQAFSTGIGAYFVYQFLNSRQDFRAERKEEREASTTATSKSTNYN